MGAHFGDLYSVQLLEKADNFRIGLYSHISWSFILHGYFPGKEFEGIGDSFVFCLVDEHTVTSVVFQRLSQIPAFSAVKIPREFLGEFLMEDDFGS